MPIFPDDSPFLVGFRKMLNIFIDAVRNYGDCDGIASKMDQWNFKKVTQSWLEVAEPMRCGFQVMNHGDIWLNNMMFKSDKENNPVDVSMIDFQVPFWASPAPDVLYFLISSVADDIKIDHFDDFIEFYHAQLTSALKELKFDQHIPTLSELHIDLLDKGAFGMFRNFIKIKSPDYLCIFL